MTTVADHLENAGFSTIAKRYLLELIYIISQEKNTSTNGHQGCNVVTFFK